MKGTKELYEKLRKRYDLPQWKEMFVLGFLEESDLKDIFSLAKAVKKALLNIQAALQNLLVPEDFVSMQDSKFVRGMRDEILDALRKTAYLTRKFSAGILEAIREEETEKRIAELIKEVVREMDGVLKIYCEAIKKAEEGWKKAEVEEEPIRYQW